MIAWHGPDNTVHCSICGWDFRCTTQEELEFRLLRHLREAHNYGRIIRRDPNTGETVELTDDEEEEKVDG